MSIWVDADACPKPLREIMFKASRRTKIELTFVANQMIPVPSDSHIKSIQVPAGFDMADHEIVRRAASGDLVITQDIPLAAELIDIGVEIITPRGESLTPANIRARLNIRDFMDTMRSSGIQTGGPKPLNDTDRRNFANLLDQYLARQK